MDQLTGFQRDCLYVIAGTEEGNAKGLVLKEKLGDYYEGEINHGRLYPNLNQLEEMGLIEKGSIDDRTNKYTLTDEGKEAIQERREWEEYYHSE
jgi:DNA-binding PadR family transcriptional regulator